MGRLRVLVADDQEYMRRAIVQLLGVEFDVVCAVGDGRKLVTTAIDLRPDVIVSSIQLPVLQARDRVVGRIPVSPVLQRALPSTGPRKLGSGKVRRIGTALHRERRRDNRSAESR